MRYLYCPLVGSGKILEGGIKKNSFKPEEGLESFGHDIATSELTETDLPTQDGGPSIAFHGGAWSS